jgi:hypothetical protein
MEHIDHNLTQQKWLYNKLLKIIPDLPEHLEKQTPQLECSVPGDRPLGYMYGFKESDNVHYITLEQSDTQNGQTDLVTSMEVRISLADQTASPISYSNRYEDLRVELDDAPEPQPRREHRKEVYTLFKTWLKSLDYRGYRFRDETESPVAETTSQRNLTRNKISHEIDR